MTTPNRVVKSSAPTPIQGIKTTTSTAKDEKHKTQYKIHRTITSSQKSKNYVKIANSDSRLLLRNLFDEIRPFQQSAILISDLFDTNVENLLATL